MGLRPMQVSHSKVLVGRRYLERGFLDAAMRLFVRNAVLVEKRDWTLLVERLMERQRIVDAVHVSGIAGIPLPCARLLALGDEHLRRRDFQATILLFELGRADRARWAQVVDQLTATPEQELRAVELADRYLTSDEPTDERRAAAAE